jgi:hypothetical protein
MSRCEVSKGEFYVDGERNFIKNNKTTKYGDQEMPSSKKTLTTMGSIRFLANPSNQEQQGRKSTGGGVPRHALSFNMYENPVANLICREIMYVPRVNLPGEWDRHVPKRIKFSRWG